MSAGVVSVWRNSQFKNEELEDVYRIALDQHAQRPSRFHAENQQSVSYNNCLYNAFRQLDGDVQRLINLLLRRRAEEGGCDRDFHYWDLVLLHEIPGGQVNTGLRRARRWWRRPECSVTEFRLVLRQIAAE